MRAGTPVLRVVVASVVLIGMLTACSAGFWDMGGIEFHLGGPGEYTHPREQVAVPFTATGRPVDDGAVCGSGIMTIDHLESMQGGTISDNAWAAMFDTAMEGAAIIEMYSFQDFECEDGSGSFSMKVHSRYDSATFAFEGEQDVGSWDIEEGTGPYSDLSGSGDVTLDWDNEDVKYDGDAR